MNTQSSKSKFPSGQILVTFAAVLLVMVLLIPTLIHMLQNRGTQTVRQTRSSEGSALCNAALNKVEWKMGMDKTLWDKVINGDTVPGYNLDTIYTDLSEGRYKVKMTAGPSQGQVTILVVAQDSAASRTEAVSAVYNRAKVNIGLKSDCNMGLNLNKVHWSPLQNLVYISDNMAALHYPRKFGMMSSIILFPSNQFKSPDGVEYFAPDSASSGLKFPEPDFSYYKNRAMASHVPTETTTGMIIDSWGKPAVATPAGSGYFTLRTNLFNYARKGSSGPGYIFRDPTAVIMHVGSGNNGQSIALNSGAFIEVEAFIAQGVYGKTYIASQGGYNGFGATIPAHADLEYAHPTAQTVWTAGGANSMSSVWSRPNRCCYSIDNVTFHGFMYTPGGYFVGGLPSPVMIGVIATPYIVETTGSDKGLTVYYDEGVNSKIRLSNPPQRASWRKVSIPW